MCRAFMQNKFDKKNGFFSGSRKNTALLCFVRLWLQSEYSEWNCTFAATVNRLKEDLDEINFFYVRLYRLFSNHKILMGYEHFFFFEM